MSEKDLTVYWAVVSEKDYGHDRQMMFIEPASLRKTLFNNRNKGNKSRQNFLKCPAVVDVVNNVFVWKSPKKTSVDLEVVDGKMKPNQRYENGDHFDWYTEHPPTLESNLLVTLDYHIIFFAEEEVEVLLTAPYFTEAPHLKSGAIVPGKVNVGAWFRPMNAEFNLWRNNTSISFEENEDIAYFTFLTDKKVRLQEFKMNQDLNRIAASMVASIMWMPYKPLRDRYDAFRRRKLRGVVLRKIKENLV
jgi:hypothetical protein